MQSTIHEQNRNQIKKEEKLIENFWKGVPMHDKARIIMVLQGVAKKCANDPASKIIGVNINDISSLVDAMRMANISQPTQELIPMAYELAIRSMEFLLFTQFVKPVDNGNTVLKKV